MNIKDDFNKKLVSLVLPMAFQAFMLALVSATDAIMLGLVDQTSLSAVSLGGQVQFVFELFVLAFATGASILAAQYWGKGDRETFERIFPIALRLNLVIGLVFTAATAFAPAGIMRLLTNDGELIASGAEYLRAVSLSYVLCGVSQIYLTALKNSDRAGTASKISAFAVVLNIVANAILIFGLLGAPKLGITGAAIATVLARVVELVWSILAMSRGTRSGDIVRIRWDLLLKREPELGADFRKYTSPVLAASLVWGIAYTLYSVIMGHMGSDAVAANSITGIAKSLVSCFTRGLGNGAGIMVGNVLGTGDMKLAKEYGRRLTHLAIVAGAITGGLIMLLSPLIVRIAPLSETASGYLQIMLIFCGVNIMFQSVNHTVLDGIFTAGGDVIFDMYGNIGAMWCFAVPLGFIAAFVLHAPATVVYCIVNLDEIVKIWAVYLRYRRFTWLKDLTR